MRCNGKSADRIRQVILFRQIRAYISRDRTQENNGYHDTEEKNNHDRVNNAEPVYSWVKNVQVVVPTGGLGDAKLTSSLKVAVYVPMEYLIPDGKVIKSTDWNIDTKLTSQVTR